MREIKDFIKKLETKLNKIRIKEPDNQQKVNQENNEASEFKYLNIKSDELQNVVNITNYYS